MAFVPNSGSVVAFQGTVPWSVLGTITGSVAAVQSGTAITSVSGVVNTAGSVVAFQGTAPWIVTGSVQATLTPAANQSVSGTVGASLIGLSPVSVSNFPTTQNVSGSVVAFQGTNPFVITGSVQGSFTPSGNQSVSGTVQVDVRGSVATVIIGGSIAASFTPPANQSVSGTVQTDVRGSVATVIIGGSIAASFTPPANQSVSGTVTVGSLLAMPGIVSSANSTTATLAGNAAFTGTSEEVKDFGSIVINVFADQVSATDGLSIQQSSNGTNWDITDTYTIAASTGKTIQVQPAGRFFRIVYTNGATIQGAFRLQTIYHPQYVKPTSQRAQDAYTNETDLEQNQNFNMVYNGATWDRLRGNIAAGVLINPGASSVLVLQTGTVVTSMVSTVPSSVLVGASIFGQLPAGTAVLGSVAALQGTNPWNIAGSVAAFQAGTRISSVSGNVTVVGSVNALMQGSWSASIAGTVSVLGTVPVTQSGTWNTSIAGTVIIGSIVGTYGEDVPSTAADKGLFTLGIRNDTVASLVGTDLDYTGWSTDSAGRHLTKPFAADEARLSYTGSVVSGSVTAIFNSVVGLRNYITDFFIANTGASNTLVTFRDGSASIIGYSAAPSGGGAMAPGLNMPIRTAPAQDLTFSVSPATSILYMTVQGYKGP